MPLFSSICPATVASTTPSSVNGVSASNRKEGIVCQSVVFARVFMSVPIPENSMETGKRIKTHQSTQ
jgi:hypothetical protein